MKSAQISEGHADALPQIRDPEPQASVWPPLTFKQVAVVVAWIYG
ncbi:hypothetical protein [Streptomyces sp. VN1]|nr:hypothetical protein [Streptomyces sp. VN1]